jgi:hypothetical protein
MITIQEINSQIIAGTFTNDQLTSINDAVKFARSRLTQQVARTLQIGAAVRFTSNRNGKVYPGILESIKIKNAIVSTAFGRYKVPMNMLEAV